MPPTGERHVGAPGWGAFQGGPDSRFQATGGPSPSSNVREHGYRPRTALGYAKDWAKLSDEELIDRLAPPTGHENVYRSHATAGNVEMTRRLVIALRDFQASSDKAAQRLVRLTVVLVALTLVIVWLTFELARHPGAG